MSKRGGSGPPAEPSIRIRMMEPGEAPALQAVIRTPSSCRAGAAPPAAGTADVSSDVVRWLLQHEIFVAEAKGGILGFAAARDLVDLYWIGGLFVPAGTDAATVGAGLLDAVLKRAGWFFHRALGLSTLRDGPDAPVFEARGFMTVADGDLPALLRDRRGAESPPAADEAGRIVMVKWL